MAARSSITRRTGAVANSNATWISLPTSDWEIRSSNYSPELLAAREDGFLVSEAVAETGWTESTVNTVAAQLSDSGLILRSGDLLVSREDIDRATEDVRFIVERFHTQNPLAQGISREELREKAALSAVSFDLVLQLLTAQ